MIMSKATKKGAMNGVGMNNTEGAVCGRAGVVKEPP